MAVAGGRRERQKMKANGANNTVLLSTDNMND
jgi:hypothetical protein